MRQPPGGMVVVEREAKRSRGYCGRRELLCSAQRCNAERGGRAEDQGSKIESMWRRCRRPNLVSVRRRGARAATGSVETRCWTGERSVDGRGGRPSGGPIRRREAIMNKNSNSSIPPSGRAIRVVDIRNMSAPARPTAPISIPPIPLRRLRSMPANCTPSLTSLCPPSIRATAAIPWPERPRWPTTWVTRLPT